MICTAVVDAGHHRSKVPLGMTDVSPRYAWTGSSPLQPHPEPLDTIQEATIVLVSCKAKRITCFGTSWPASTCLTVMPACAAYTSGFHGIYETTSTVMKTGLYMRDSLTLHAPSQPCYTGASAVQHFTVLSNANCTMLQRRDVSCDTPISSFSTRSLSHWVSLRESSSSGHLYSCSGLAS